MINKLFKRGRGKTSSAIDYILGNKQHDGTDRPNMPKVMYGDPSQVAQIGDGLHFKNKYTSGVLSFTAEEKARLTDEQLKAIIDSHLEQMTIGIGSDNLSICYVKHDDHDHLEIHYVAANQDLESQKYFNPFVATRGDIKRFDVWKDLMIATHELDNPNDLERRQLFRENNNLPKTVKEAKKSLHDFLSNRFDAGLITCRQDLIEAAEEMGFKKTDSNSKKSLSFSHPDFKRNFRMTGDFYNEESWNNIDTAPEKAKRTRAETAAANIANVRELTQRLKIETERTLYGFGNRYDRNTGGLEKVKLGTRSNSEREPLNSLESITSNLGNNRRDSVSDFLLLTLEQSSNKLAELKVKLSDLLTKAKRRLDLFSASEIQQKTKAIRVTKHLGKLAKLKAYGKAEKIYRKQEIAKENAQLRNEQVSKIEYQMER